MILCLHMNARDKLTGWLHSRKDSSVSFVVEKLLQKRLEAYGRLLEFELNSRHQTASLKILLKGEMDPVTLNVEQYVLLVAANGADLTIKHASASRPWITQILEEFVIGRPFPIPAKYTNIVRMLL
jgi:hypothetical protein